VEWTHVYPENDLIQHNVDGEWEGCLCDPKVDVEINLIVHNSMDRREVYEKDNTLDKT